MQVALLLVHSATACDDHLHTHMHTRAVIRVFLRPSKGAIRRHLDELLGEQGSVAGRDWIDDLAIEGPDLIPLHQHDVCRRALGGWKCVCVCVCVNVRVYVCVCGCR